MQPSFAFYIHHHGSGHFMRALAIASRLTSARVTFLGSDLKRFQTLLPAHIHCVHLPMDVVTDTDAFASFQRVDFLHYAPLNVSGLLERSEKIVKTLKAHFPVILIVDVSVEVTMLAALCGVPTIVVRQNGKRDDVPHLNAYQSARMLLASCPRTLMDQSTADWVDSKTFYSGGFCRYSERQIISIPVTKGKIGILIGAGGTSIGFELVTAIAQQCQPYTFHLIGEISIPAQGSAAGNIIFHGPVEDPAELLADCEVVIGNAGHNTVMEMAALNKKFICITEERPFQEQVCKGALLSANNIAVVLTTNQNLKQQDWSALIQKAQDLPENCWEGVIDPNALDVIADQFLSLWEEIFTSKQHRQITA